MFTKSTIALLLSAALTAPLLAKDFFVAPTGNNTNPGTLQAPVASLMKAQQLASPGDTVYLRGGAYTPAESDIRRTNGIFAYYFDFNKSGAKDAPIRYLAYQNEKPSFDFSKVKPADLRVIAFYIEADYLQFKGIDITGVQVTIKTHTQSECFEIQGSNNTFEQLTMHDGQAIGIYLLNGSNNLFLNCDAWNNHDFTSENGKGGNTDGFGCHPRKGAVNNVFRGCRAWFNSDDGYDCINAAEAVTFENCWAMYNGYSAKMESLGDGNGFKAGGYGATPADRLPTPIPRHTVRFCLAVGNKNSGIYSNHHTGGCDFINNTSYKNGINFNFLERLPDNTKDIPGKGHKIINNLGYKGKTEVANLAPEGNDLGPNSFSISPPLQLTDPDFLSLDEKQLTAPRNPDGSLPTITFMHPSPNSHLPPELGCFAPPHK